MSQRRLTEDRVALSSQGSMIRTPLVFALAAVLICTIQSRAQNLMLNSGFEEGPGDYVGVGLHWETNDDESHPEVDALTTGTRHSGSYSQWLKANPTWDLGMVRQVSAYNSVTAGLQYRVSAWVKTANVQNPAGWYVFGIWWFDDSVRVPGEAGEEKMPQQETLNYDWREISWITTAPAGANRVAAILTRHTDGDAWYDDVFIGEYSSAPPIIAIAPMDGFTHRLIVGSALPDDYFTVRNAGGSTLNYIITADAGWLNANPAAGESTGETDDIALEYDVTGLPVGIHETSVTVSDPEATPSEESFAVSLAIRTPGDMDYDNDVDQADFGLFQICYTGEGHSQDDPACQDARMDIDLDVDLDDFALFQECISGAGMPADPHCADAS